MVKTADVRKVLSDMGIGTSHAWNDKRMNYRRIKIVTNRFLTGKEKYRLMQAVGAYHVGVTPPHPGVSFGNALTIYIAESNV